MRPGLLCPGKAAGFQQITNYGDASMRPGLLCPGKGHAGEAQGGQETGFNEAGAVMPRKARVQRRPAGRRAGASMRPGLLCPGKLLFVFVWPPVLAASMRPGLLCPGKAVEEVRNNESMEASMRPGLLCPGKHSAHRRRRRPCAGFNEAGAVMPRKATRSPASSASPRLLQ